MTLNKKLVIIYLIIFVSFVLAAVLIGYIKPDNNTAVITVDGKKVYEADLTKPRSFDVNTQNGTNSIVISDGNIYIKDATCPDKLCVRHGILHNKYDSIVCLPNKLVIEYKSEKTVDAVSGR